MTTIKFKDLSGWLKTAVIFVWIMSGFVGIAFLVGFISELI